MPTQSQASGNPNMSASNGASGPGAFSVDSSSSQGTVFRVSVPQGVIPGQEFQVHAGDRIVRVRCPPDTRPGQFLQITVPRDSDETQNGPPGHHRPSDQTDDSSGEAFQVVIPQGVSGGQQFHVMFNGNQLTVTCPANASAGMKVRIMAPKPRPDIGRATDVTRGPRQQQPARPRPEATTEMFEVVVPPGINAGQPFALMAGGQRVLVTCPPNAISGQKIDFSFLLHSGGQRVLVTCPPNAISGQKIRFQLPIALTQPRVKKDGTTTQKPPELVYDDGWMRSIRVTDMKFQWIRMDKSGEVKLPERFDQEKSAYVRFIDFGDKDQRIRTGTLSLVPADQGVVESRVRGTDGEDLVTYAEIASAQGKSFEEKVDWFHDTCRQIRVSWNEGHMRMNVRRESMLSDSMEAVMSLSCKDLRKDWRFYFIGEEGIDAGGLSREWFQLVTQDLFNPDNGLWSLNSLNQMCMDINPLAREWFQLVTQEIFNPDNGLWLLSSVNQMCMDINPASELSHPEDHLIYFRFLGRVLGKGLFDRQLVSGHMVRHYYKHLLGWPITFDDLELVDEDIFNSCKTLQTMEDVSCLYLDFTVTEDTLGVKKEIELVKNGADMSCLYLDFTVTEDTMMGVKKEIELVKNGADIDVTNDNLPEYLECRLKYWMVGRVRPQLTELLLGFFDVIPEPLLTVFDFQELELVMCGMPTIDMDDWKAHTEYSGHYEDEGEDHQVVQWFWEVVSDVFDMEYKARLLQFVTGTAGVPARGFSVLQGNDG
eukprot:CAMPEP_0194393738 /NCGR_PEP_ID=MMETSP0174-20130528/123464_1 /TAXON_ID=216777 /ORGANISM="Proboscia alata, Strain PI-D3" /LENGTH=763 /DNA_ID=CAMNT_0039189457 /DNA_START=265 /DNA_END=2553 /DNA_ORIENTATION=-